MNIQDERGFQRLIADELVVRCVGKPTHFCAEPEGTTRRAHAAV